MSSEVKNITAAIKLSSGSVKTPHLPSFPPELIIYTLGFLPWEEIIFYYGILPTRLVDAALINFLYEAKLDKKPFFYLSSCYSLFCNPTEDSREGIWLRYSQFDPDARILWFSPRAAEGRHFYKVPLEAQWTMPKEYGFRLTMATKSNAAPRIWKVLGSYADVVQLVRAVDDFGPGLKIEELSGNRVRLCGVDHIVEGYVTPGIPEPASPDDIKTLEEAMRIDDQELDYQQQYPLVDNASISALISEAHESHTHAPKHTVPLELFPPSPHDRNSFLCNHTGILFVDRVGLTLSSFFQFSRELPCQSNSWQPRKSARLPPDPAGTSTMYPRRLRWVRDRLAREYPRGFPVRRMVSTFFRIGIPDELTEERMYMMLFVKEVKHTKEKAELEKKVLARARELMQKLGRERDSKRRR